MIDDVLKDVREAEQKAEQLQKDAYARGKEIVLKAEAEAESHKKSTVKECKEERSDALKRARLLADERTREILAEGEKLAEELANEKAAAVDTCADKVANILFSKYVTE